MMKNELRPYEEYKTAVIPWLDQIPGHWEVKRAKSLYVKENRPTRETDEVITCFRDGVVTLRKNRRTTGFTESLKEIGYQGIRKGDLVIHVMDAFAGAVGVSDSDGKGTPVYSVCVPKEDLNNYYYAHIVREMAKTGFIQSLYRGIRERSSDFRFEVFANQYLPIPPREEQDQIVNYLDYKLAKINTFIKAKKKLIAVLKEQKLAIINQAVTKGLDPDVKMKPSGIEWLGNVPEHWEIRRLKNIGNAIIGLTYNPGEVTDETGTLVLRSSNIQNGGIVLNDNVYVKKVIPTHLKTKVGDILVCSRNGSRKLIGKCGMIDEVTKDLSFGAFTTIFRSDSNDFVYYLFNSMLFTYQIGSFFTSTINQLTINNFKSLIVPFPPKYEQERIVNYLRKELVALEKSISTIEQEVELINEFKNSLITNAVTGKIDVRNILIEEIDRENADEVDFDVEDENEIEEELIDEGGDE